MSTKTTICTIPIRYCPAPALLAAALMWRASKIETLPSLVAPAMRIGTVPCDMLRAAKLHHID